MDTRKDNIPTYSKVRGKYNGQIVTGVYKDDPKRLCLDTQGSIRWELIEEPVVVYDVGKPIENTTANGTSGVIPMSNGLDANYGPFSQYKTKEEVMPLMQAISELCTGIDISISKLGRAMGPQPKYAPIDLNCYIKFKPTAKGIKQLIENDEKSGMPKRLIRTAESILSEMDENGMMTMQLHIFMYSFKEKWCPEMVEMQMLVETRQ